MFGLKKRNAQYSEKGYSNDEQMQGAGVVPNKTFKIKS
jgi:hypothetical protein